MNSYEAGLEGLSPGKFPAFLPAGRLALLPFAVAITGYVFLSLTYLNHDVAWVLLSSGWLFDGKVIGSDIIAANPPLIWWLSAVPAGIARLLDVSPVIVFRLFMMFMIGASLFSADRLLRANGDSYAGHLTFLALGAFVFTIGTNRDFGQREVISLILVLPYLLMAAGRMRENKVQVKYAIATGIAVGLGIALKPYFIAVPALVELALAVRSRDLRRVIRTETVAATGVAICYAVAVLLFARAWITEVVPSVSAVYWAFSFPFALVAHEYQLDFVVLALVVVIVWQADWPREATTLTAAAVGYLVAALAQGKGYTYHFYPVMACLLLAFALAIPKLRALKPLAASLFALILVYQGAISVTRIAALTRDGFVGSVITEVTEFVRDNVPQDGSFLAISTHPFPGFPTAIYAERSWASPSNSHIYLPAVVRLREKVATADGGLLAYAEGNARKAITRDLANMPDLVIIDVREHRHAIGNSSFDFLSFYLEDPAFAEVWKRYIPTDHAPEGFAAFIRKESVR